MSARPKISRRRVVAKLIDMLESGRTAEQVAKVLAAYLVETRQTRNTELYIRDIELQVAERFGVVAAYVFSAKKLTEQIRERVTKLVKSATNAKAVQMIERVDSGLIGGIVVKTADAELDGSVRTKLRN